MPVDRPTFSESWYRVAALKPRLRPAVQIHRQHFRGQTWYVVQDPATNEFSRLNVAAYHFVGMLDGRRTVAEVWQACNETLGDDAPTQGEAIQLLGQLYTMNLLKGDLPPDAEGLFQRYRKRVRREVQSYAMNFLFIRIPLFDPDRILDRWVWLFGRMFTWYGLAVWLALMAAAFYALAGRFGALADRGSGILDAENLPLLYVALVLVKVCHEFGHAFACKKFGRTTGTGGEVHTMGVMFLVFTPLPYVDASSAYAFRNKWQRVIVNASGMYVELGVAALAALVYANTGQGHPVHAIAYNMMFIASVSSLLFNGNPLLRYDGYYILSDLTEIANLAPRSRQYLYYLVKRYAWGVRRARSPAHTRGERAWMLFYVVASTAYRVLVCVGIFFFVANKFFTLGVVLAVGAVVAWLVVPLGKFVRYLATSNELARVRARAVATTVAFAAALVVAVGLIPAPDRCRLDGVVEPDEPAVVFTGAPGFLRAALPSGREVTPEGEPLIVLANPELGYRLQALEADRARHLARRRQAMTEHPASVQIVDEQIAALDDQIAEVRERLAALEVRAPVAGTWVAPEAERRRGTFLERGQHVGLVVPLERLRIHATAGQDIAALIINEGRAAVEVRVKGRPDLAYRAEIEEIFPAGSEMLPSAALGYAAGGRMPVRPDDPEGMRAAEPFFDVLLRPEAEAIERLRPGQVVVVRVDLETKPLYRRWKRQLLQLVMRRLRG